MEALRHLNMIEIIPNFHPLLVHFTIALFSISVVLFFFANRFYGTEWADYAMHGANLNLWFGAGISILTAFAGWDAYNTVDHDSASHLAMTDHRNWAIATLVLFYLLTFWNVTSTRVRENVPNTFVFLCIIGLGLLMTTGYKGAEVVYRHGIGVISLPDVTAKGHGHSHADGHAHDHGSNKEAPKEKPQENSGKHMDDGHAHHESTEHAHDNSEDHTENHEHEKSHEHKNTSSDHSHNSSLDAHHQDIDETPHEHDDHNSSENHEHSHDSIE